MSPWLALAAWLALFVLSVAAHEIGHVVAGLRLGWSYQGVLFKPWVLAVGVRMDANGKERETWKIALAGPAATAGCVALFWVVPGQMSESLFWINVSVLTINLLPVWQLDGGQALRSLRQRGA